MVIFNSYVSLPEGNQYTKINDQLQKYAWTGLFFMMVQRLWKMFCFEKKWLIIYNNIK